MDDYISRAAAIKALENQGKENQKWVGLPETINLCTDFSQAINVINAIPPAADVRPVKRGAWEQREVYDARGNVYELQSAFCPICKRYHTTLYLYSFTHYDYCPNCGAKMDEIEKSIDAHAKRGRCGRADMTGGADR